MSSRKSTSTASSKNRKSIKTNLKSKSSKSAAKRRQSQISFGPGKSNYAKPPDPHWQSRTFGVFEKKLEAPVGFYREKDHYYNLKNEYSGEDSKMRLIEEMWAARENYQIKKRFKWPPKCLVGRMFWTWGYYDDTFRQRHAHVLQDPSGVYFDVTVEEEGKDVESSDDEYGRNPFYDKFDEISDWEAIRNRYRVWKSGKKQLKGTVDDNSRKSQTAIPVLGDSLMGKTATGLFRDELDNVDFDALEAELLRRKSLGLINTPSYDRLVKRKSSFYAKDKDVDVIEDEDTITTVTTEYILVKPDAKEKRKSRAAARKSKAAEDESGSSQRRKSRKSRKSEAGRKSMAEDYEDEDSDEEDYEDDEPARDKRKSRKSNAAGRKSARKSRKSQGAPKGTKVPPATSRGVILPGLTAAESEALWAAYDQADSDKSQETLVATTKTERKSMKPTEPLTQYRKSVKK